MSEIIQINENSWRIEDKGVRFFLLTGTKEALLIDSGMQTPNAREIAESLTKLPLQILNTHADPDHISGNGMFDSIYPSHGGFLFHRRRYLNLFLVRSRFYLDR